MKTKFTSSEIAHVWAHQSAPRGTSPGAMSFEGDCFYSYRACIARRIKHGAKVGYLINTHSYSVTTSGHQSTVRQAIPHGETLLFVDFSGDSLNFTPAELVERHLSEAASMEAKASEPRVKKEKWLALAGAALERAKALVEFYGLKTKIDGEAVARFAAANAREEKKRAKEARERKIRQAKEEAERLTLWLAGDTEVYQYFTASAIQFRIEGEELVSTRGARMPLADAERAVRFALARRTKGWRANGETCPVGMYRLDSINEQGVIAGCHRIAWSEVERLSGLLATVPA